MPINDYRCPSCGWEEEILTTKISDVKDSTECPHCGATTKKLMSIPHIRMGSVFTVGGPTIHDKDGHESLGMTGENFEESMKTERDKRQFIESGKGDAADFAISQSPTEG